MRPFVGVGARSYGTSARNLAWPVRKPLVHRFHALTGGRRLLWGSTRAPRTPYHAFGLYLPRLWPPVTLSFVLFLGLAFYFCVF